MAQFDTCNSHKTKHTKTGLYNKVFLLSAIYILVRYIQCCANCSIHLHGICSRVDLMARTLFYVMSNRGRGGFRCRVVAIWTWPSIYLSLRNCRWGVSRGSAVPSGTRECYRYVPRKCLGRFWWAERSTWSERANCFVNVSFMILWWLRGEYFTHWPEDVSIVWMMACTPWGRRHDFRCL